MYFSKVQNYTARANGCDWENQILLTHPTQSQRMYPRRNFRYLPWKYHQRSIPHWYHFPGIHSWIYLHQQQNLLASSINRSDIDLVQRYHWLKLQSPIQVPWRRQSRILELYWLKVSWAYLLKTREGNKLSGKIQLQTKIVPSIGKSSCKEFSCSLIHISDDSQNIWICVVGVQNGTCLQHKLIGAEIRTFEESNLILVAEIQRTRGILHDGEMKSFNACGRSISAIVG